MEFKVFLLLVDALFPVRQHFQLLVNTIDGIYIIWIAFCAEFLSKAIDVQFDFVKFILEFLDFNLNFDIDVFALLSKTDHAILNQLCNSLDLDVRILDLLLDLITSLIVWKVIHQVYPLDKFVVLPCDVHTLLCADLCKLSVVFHQLMRFLGILVEWFGDLFDLWADWGRFIHVYLVNRLGHVNDQLLTLMN